MTVSIRPERPTDRDAIAALITEAFEHAEHRSGTEAKIVAALRGADALTLSIVAAEGELIIGHAAFSPVTIDGNACGWFGLGPVAVDPGRRRQGVADRLIRHGLQQLEKDGAKGCVVLGDPAYYRRFGFVADGRLTLAGVPPEYFQSLAFGDRGATGAVAYHPAFDVA